MSIESKILPDTKEAQTIASAAKVTKRLEGNEVVIEIRIPAYIYSEIKDWSNLSGSIEHSI